MENKNLSITKRPAIIEGYLYKWTNYLQGYRNRLFSLQDDKLSYYKILNDTSKALRGVISLDTAIISKIDSLNFTIIIPNAIFKLRCADKEECQHWIKVLKAAKVCAVGKTAGIEDIDTDNSLSSSFIEEKDEINTLLTKLNTKISQVKDFTDEVFKSAAQLEESLEELKAVADKPNLVMMKLLTVKMKIAEFRVTALSLMNANVEHFNQCNLHYVVFLRLLKFEKRSQSNEDWITEIFPHTTESSLKQQVIERKLNDNQVSDLESDDDVYYDAHCSNSVDDKLSTDRLETTGPRLVPRRRLTIPQRPKHNLNPWSFIRKCVGKDMGKISLPVDINEPLSLLQRATEGFGYSELLDKAAQAIDPLEQMVLVAAFSVALYANDASRFFKPFNPLLHETYEFDRTEDLGWRCFSELVAHRPPRFAQHCEGRGWKLWRDLTITYAFSGVSLSIQPVGTLHLEFNDSGHHYVWKKVTTKVHNLLFGKLWVDNCGETKIGNHTTSDQALISFHQYSYLSKDASRRIKGVIKNSDGEAKWALQGCWDQKIEAAKVISSKVDSSSGTPVLKTESFKVVWKRNIPSPEYEQMYNFTPFTAQLNEPEPNVAPTDSRLRPDQRLAEEGNFSEANMIKVKLENKQRVLSEFLKTMSTATPNSALTGTPLWFKQAPDPITGNIVYIFTGEYWQCKEMQDWRRCPTIFLYEQEMDKTAGGEESGGKFYVQC